MSDDRRPECYDIAENESAAYIRGLKAEHSDIAVNR